MDAAARRVEGELADGDGHAAGALVTQAQDALVVGDHDEPHVAERPLAEDAGDPVARRPGVIQVPRVRRMIWLNSWHARPTVGV